MSTRSFQSHRLVNLSFNKIHWGNHSYSFSTYVFVVVVCYALNIFNTYNVISVDLFAFFYSLNIIEMILNVSVYDVKCV